MCGHQIDHLPRRAISFGLSWPGFAVGLAAILALAYGFMQFQARPSRSFAIAPTATLSFIPPTFTATPTITPTPTRPPTLTPTPRPPTATQTPLVHIIRTGDTLSFLADRYGVTVEEIRAANNIDETTILQIDQPLIIPVASLISVGDTPIIERRGPVITYTVQSGDTLSGIAFDHGVSLAAIEQANPGIDLDLLSLGQEITIPFAPPTFTPTPTITPTPTFTPGPEFEPPYLLWPPDGTLIEGDGATVLLNWATSQILDQNTFYVIFLTDELGNTKTFWTEAGSYRLPENLRPKQLTTFSWYVVVMERLGVDQNGAFYGNPLSAPSQTRAFLWR
jgi:LysM repeat protein